MTQYEGRKCCRDLGLFFNPDTAIVWNTEWALGVQGAVMHLFSAVRFEIRAKVSALSLSKFQ